MIPNKDMTWVEAARLCIRALDQGTEEDKAMARDEIIKMATVADMAVDLQHKLDVITERTSP